MHLAANAIRSSSNLIFLDLTALTVDLRYYLQQQTIYLKLRNLAIAIFTHVYAKAAKTNAHFRPFLPPGGLVVAALWRTHKQALGQ